MASSESQPDIILYDLASTKGVCFSPVVWRTRLLLNYKGVNYKTIFVEFPDIESTLKPLGLVPAQTGGKYTVPAIHHIPTGTYIMDSTLIAQFLTSTYPTPVLPLKTEWGTQIESHARSLIGPVLSTFIMPREINILSPRSQTYFRTTREAALGHPLEDFLDPMREEETWGRLDGSLREVGEMLRKHADKGPFTHGKEPTYTDFFLAGALQSARMVDERVFERMTAYSGFKEVYNACEPFMTKRD